MAEQGDEDDNVEVGRLRRAGASASAEASDPRRSSRLPSLSTTFTVQDKDLLGLLVSCLRIGDPAPLAGMVQDPKGLRLLLYADPQSLGLSEEDVESLADWQQLARSPGAKPSEQFAAAVQAMLQTYLCDEVRIPYGVSVEWEGTRFTLRLDGKLPSAPEELETLRARLEGALRLLTGIKDLEVTLIEGGLQGGGGRAKVGRFEVNLDRVLGSGGFAQVFRAVDRTASPPLWVAAKRGAAEELRKEAQLLELVAGHPAIIGLHGFVEGPDPGEAFLFLEMCSGGELFERVSDGGQLSERAARPIAKGIAEALRHCLSRGVVHRNVGLENVMLSAEDPKAIKLIDFGLACTVPLAPDGSLKPVLLYDCVGSTSYMAPELFFASEGYHAPPVDCWAYGVLVFSLLAGFFPFEEAKASDWRFARLAQSGVGPCDAIYRMYNRSCPFSLPARELCDALLVIDANTRATIEQCLEHPWLSAPPPSAASGIATAAAAGEKTTDPPFVPAPAAAASSVEEMDVEERQPRGLRPSREPPRVDAEEERQLALALFATSKQDGAAPPAEAPAAGPAAIGLPAAERT